MNKYSLYLKTRVVYVIIGPLFIQVKNLIEIKIKFPRKTWHPGSIIFNYVAFFNFNINM